VDCKFAILEFANEFHFVTTEESQCGAERFGFVFWLRVVHMSKAAGLTFFGLLV
jgi:hypothetical protein